MTLLHLRFEEELYPLLATNGAVVARTKDGQTYLITNDVVHVGGDEPSSLQLVWSGGKLEVYLGFRALSGYALTRVSPRGLEPVSYDTSSTTPVMTPEGVRPLDYYLDTFISINGVAVEASGDFYCADRNSLALHFPRLIAVGWSPTPFRVFVSYGDGLALSIAEIGCGKAPYARVLGRLRVRERRGCFFAGASGTVYYVVSEGPRLLAYGVSEGMDKREPDDELDLSELGFSSAVPVAQLAPNADLLLVADHSGAIRASVRLPLY